MKEPRGCNARRVCQRAPRVSFAAKAGLGFKVGIGLAALGFAYAYPVLNTQAADVAHAVVAVASEDSERNSSMPSLPESSAPGSSDPAGTAPAEPAPTTPSTSEPRTPNPTQPGPTNPSVTHPAPTHPGPTQPGPTDPSATNPSPTYPYPTHPSPTAPSEDLTPSTGPTQGDEPTASPSDSGQSSEREVASETSIDAPAHATTVDTQRSKIHGGPGMATPQGLKPAQAKRVPVVLREVPNGTPPTNGAPTSTKMHVIYKVEKAPEPTLGTVNVEPVADVNETAKGIGTAVGGGVALFAIALWGLLRGHKI